MDTQNICIRTASCGPPPEPCSPHVGCGAIKIGAGCVETEHQRKGAPRFTGERSHCRKVHSTLQSCRRSSTRPGSYNECQHAREGGRPFRSAHLSDLKLIRTVRLPHGPRGNEGNDPAKPRVLADGRTVVVSSFNSGPVPPDRT